MQKTRKCRDAYRFFEINEGLVSCNYSSFGRCSFENLKTRYCHHKPNKRNGHNELFAIGSLPNELPTKRYDFSANYDIIYHIYISVFVFYRLQTIKNLTLKKMKDGMKKIKSLFKDLCEHRIFLRRKEERNHQKLLSTITIWDILPVL